MSALKPCPFCGEEAQLHFGAVEFFDVEVQCKACGVVSGNYGDGTQEQNEAAAIAAWNRRAGDGEMEKLREALRHYADQYCEGWCKEAGGQFADCGGCRARAALKDGDAT